MNRSMSVLCWITLFFLLFAVGSTQVVAGEKVFKEGQEISFIVPYSAGGGYDSYARLIAPFWADEIKKETGAEVNIIVRNMPGAGGDIAYTKMNRTSPDDPTVLIAQMQGALGFQMFRDASYDVTEWTYIGQVQADSPGLVVRSDLGLWSFDQIAERSKQKPLVVGTAGFGDGTHVNPELLKGILANHGREINFKYVHYKGLSNVRAAFQRGEIEAAFGTTESFMTLYEEGVAHLVVIFDTKRKPFNPAVPTVLDYQLPGADEILTAVIIPRAVVAPPGMPDNVADTLRSTFEKVLTSAEFKQKAKLAQRPIDYLPQEDLKQIMQNKLDVFKKYETILRPLIGG